jgi:serine/threonine protein phosphatase PrpC
MDIYSASVQGKRKSNEDEITILTNIDSSNKKKNPINLFGIYDGHGGKFVASHLSKNLPPYFMDKRLEYPIDKKYAKKLYDKIQKDLKNKYAEEATEAGSTCLIVVQYKHNSNVYLNVLNTGDSRCVLCRNGLDMTLTKDHKPDWPEEKKRITDLGGKLEFDNFDWRICSLSVSRAFGDISAEPYVTCSPDIYKYKITNDDQFFILACDGLWDVMSGSDVVNYILTNKEKDKNIAVNLAKHAIAKGSQDNISIIIVFLK